MTVVLGDQKISGVSANLKQFPRVERSPHDLNSWLNGACVRSRDLGCAAREVIAAEQNRDIVGNIKGISAQLLADPKSIYYRLYHMQREMAVDG
jgi:hypothetical protein